jgi:hypothetical protein
VHEPVRAARIDAPTIADARRLAAQIEAIVRAGVERAEETAQSTVASCDL